MTSTSKKHGERDENEEEWDAQASFVVFGFDEEIPTKEECDFESLSVAFTVSEAETKEEIDFDAQVGKECSLATCIVVIKPSESLFVGKDKFGEIDHVWGEEEMASVIEN